MVAREKTVREVSIDYLRAFVTLLVLAHHSSLAYTTFAHADAANYLMFDGSHRGLATLGLPRLRGEFQRRVLHVPDVLHIRALRMAGLEG